MILYRYFFWNNLSKVMSSLLDNSSSPSEVDSLDLDEVSCRSIFNINHYFDSLWSNKALTHGFPY